MAKVLDMKVKNGVEGEKGKNDSIVGTKKKDISVSVTGPKQEEKAAAPNVIIGYSLIPIELLDPNPYQPRKHFDEEALEELSKSIKQTGLLQHPVVRKVGDRYQIIAGERRTRAIKLLGWKEISVNVVEMTDAEVATAALVENLQRQDVSPLSTARAIDRMISEFGMKQGQMAKDLGVTQAKVSQMLALLKLADPLLEALEKGELSPSIGRIVGTLNKEVQLSLLHNLDDFYELTVKDIQFITNQIKYIETMIPKEPIHVDDSIRIKFVKFMNEKGLIDLFECYDNIPYYSNSDMQKLETIKEFYLSQRNTFDSSMNDTAEIVFLREAINKPLMPYDHKCLELGLKDDIELVKKAVNEFMSLYLPYEPPAPKASGHSIKGIETDKPKEPSVPRITKEEKQEMLQAAQENSPITVLNVSKGTTKSERLLKRIQEHQGDPVHELSQRCYNCTFFKSDAEDYAERCGAQYGFSINQFDRFEVSGKPDLFICDKYSPKEEQVEKEKVTGLDPEVSLLRLLLNDYSLSNLHRLMPELAKKNLAEVITAYQAMDSKSKAYFISAVSHRKGLERGVESYLLLPNGEQLFCKSKMIVGADDM